MMSIMNLQLKRTLSLMDTKFSLISSSGSGSGGIDQQKCEYEGGTRFTACRA